MISTFSQFNESIAVPASIRKRTFFHGCHKEPVAKLILSDGFLKPGRTKESRVHLAPIAGKVYCTSSLPYAVIYAIGGSMIGKDISSWVKSEEERYGYVFAFGTKRLTSVLPDEDMVGDILNMVMVRAAGKDPIGESGDDIKKAVLNWTPEQKTKLIHFAENILTPTQLYRAQDRFAEYAHMAVIGKKMLKKMPHDMMTLFVEAGCALANEGPIKYDTAYKFDKLLCKELKPDCSNFFDLAEVVSGQSPTLRKGGIGKQLSFDFD